MFTCRVIRFLFLAGACSFLTSCAIHRIGGSAPPLNVFLKEHLPAVHWTRSETRVDFTGAFLPIASDLQQRLENAFPDHKFVIARMRFQHWGPEDVNLLVVLDKPGTRVVSYLWSRWFDDDAPFTFATLLSKYHEIDDAALLNRVKILGELVGLVSGDSVLNSTVANGEAIVTLVEHSPSKRTYLLASRKPKGLVRYLSFEHSTETN